MVKNKTISDIDDYEQILWLSDIPKEQGFFNAAWDKKNDEELWLEITAPAADEPKKPIFPNEVLPWLEDCKQLNFYSFSIFILITLKTKKYRNKKRK